MKKKILSLKKVLIIEVIALLVMSFCLIQIESFATKAINRRNILQKVEYVEAAVTDYNTVMGELYTNLLDYQKHEVDFITFLDNHIENFDAQRTIDTVFKDDDLMINPDQDALVYYQNTGKSGEVYATGYMNSDKWSFVSEMESYAQSTIDEIIEQSDYFMSVDQNGIIISSSVKENVGKNVEILGIKLSDIPVDDASWLIINGEKYYTASKIKAEDGAYYVIGLKSQTINTNNRITAYLLCAIMWIVGILIVTYYYFLRQENPADRKLEDQIIHESIVNKAYTNPWILCLLGVVIIGMAAFHIQSLFGLSVYSMQKNSEAAYMFANSNLLSNQYLNMDAINQFVDGKKADIIADAMGMYPEICNSKSLREIKDIFNLEFIEQKDIDENVIATSALYKEQYKDWGSELLSSDYDLFLSQQTRETLKEHSNQTVVEPILNNGELTSYATIGSKIDFLMRLQSSMTVQNFMDKIPTQKGSYIICINAETNTVLYSSIGADTGISTAALGIPDAALSDGSFLTVNLEGTKYYSTSITMDKYIVMLLSKSQSIFNGRIEITLATMFMFGILLAALILMIQRSKVEPSLAAVAADNNDQDDYRPAIIKRIQDNVAWNQKSAEGKAMFIARSIYHFLSFVVIAIVLLRGSLYNDSTIFGFLVNARWEKGVNIFSITAIVITWFVFSVVMNIVRYLFQKLLSIVTLKSETIIRLIRSFVIYGSVLGMIFYSMNLIGLDSESLIASAGLMGLVISWGAKDLITDILAGLFIIFEHQFQVGDIIEVHGDKGTVIEIGVRTTRLVTPASDSLVISNRDLTNIINKSKSPSAGGISIYVSYREDLLAIEKMLEEELPKLKDPRMVGNPGYGGVTEFGEQTMRLAIGFKCQEQNKFGLGKWLSTEIYRIFKEHGIELGRHPLDDFVSEYEDAS